MNVGDGSLVGMSVLPKGIAPEGDDSIEDEADDEVEGGDGPWLLSLTKKASCYRGAGSKVL